MVGQALWSMTGVFSIDICREKDAMGHQPAGEILRSWVLTLALTSTGSSALESLLAEVCPEPCPSGYLSWLQFLLA